MSCHRGPQPGMLTGFPMSTVCHVGCTGDGMPPVRRRHGEEIYEGTILAAMASNKRNSKYNEEETGEGAGAQASNDQWPQSAELYEYGGRGVHSYYNGIGVVECHSCAGAGVCGRE